MAARILLTIHDAAVLRAEVNRTLTRPFGVVELGCSASSATVFCNTAADARAIARAFAEVADSLELADLSTAALRDAVTGA